MSRKLVRYTSVEEMQAVLALLERYGYREQEGFQMSRTSWDTHGSHAVSFGDGTFNWLRPAFAAMMYGHDHSCLVDGLEALRAYLLETHGEPPEEVPGD